MMAIIYVPEAGEASRPTQQSVLCAFSWTWNWSEGTSRLGGHLVVARTLLGPCVNNVEEPDWYVGLRQAPVLDMLPKLVPFTNKDFRINWQSFG